MNLALHRGWLGALEAGAIAFAVGLLLFALFHRLAARGGWPPGHAIGWSSLLAVAVAAGIDLWLLFQMGVVRLESPLRAKIFLSKIHDPDFLHARVVFEVLGALAGVVAGWLLAEARRPASPPGP